MTDALLSRKQGIFFCALTGDETDAGLPEN